jgi:hypothetical protein
MILWEGKVSIRCQKEEEKTNIKCINSISKAYSRFVLKKSTKFWNSNSNC